MDMLIGILMMLGVPGYFVLQVLLPWRYQRGWRIAALLPLVVMLPAMAHATYALRMESNLWPILVVLSAPVLFLYLCAVATAHFFARGDLL